MSWRQTELAHFSDQLTWLADTLAAEEYAKAIASCSKIHYGLDSKKVQHIERCKVDTLSDDPSDWLSRRTGTDAVKIVFGKSDVCITDAAFFISNWRDMFCPSRDDVIVFPELSDGILYYSHEDEFEYGIRHSA